MVTFQCETKGCGHILLNSSKRYAYELAGFTCPKCHKTGAWKNYTGEIHEAVLAREDVRIVGLKQKLLLALAERDRLKIEFDQACAERRNCELAYNALHNPDIPTIVSELGKTGSGSLILRSEVNLTPFPVVDGNERPVFVIAITSAVRRVKRRLSCDELKNDVLAMYAHLQDELPADVREVLLDCAGPVVTINGVVHKGA